jgi:hypothetical protein
LNGVNGWVTELAKRFQDTLTFGDVTTVTGDHPD